MRNAPVTYIPFKSNGGLSDADLEDAEPIVQSSSWAEKSKAKLPDSFRPPDGHPGVWDGQN